MEVEFEVSIDVAEYCCLCDVTAKNEEEFTAHLDSTEHLSELVKNKFLSQKLFEMFGELQKCHQSQQKNPGTFCVDEENNVASSQPILNEEKDEKEPPATTPSRKRSSTICSENDNELPSCSLQEVESSSKTSSSNDEMFLSGVKDEIVAPKSIKLEFRSTTDTDCDRESLNDTITQPIDLPGTSTTDMFSRQEVNLRDSLPIVDHTDENNPGPSTGSSKSVCSHVSGLSESILMECLPLSLVKSQTAVDIDTLPDFKLDKECNFAIYQCSTCKCLINRKSFDVLQHFGSPAHVDFVQGLDNSVAPSQYHMVCLVCDLAVRDCQLHKLNSSHLQKVRSLMKNNFATKILEIAERINVLKQWDPIRASFTSFNKHAKQLDDLMYHQFDIAKHIMMNLIDRKQDYLPKVSATVEETVPGLKNFWDCLLKDILPESLRQFKSLFLCSICGCVFANYYDLVHHTICNLNHMALSSFSHLYQGVFCLACDKPHYGSRGCQEFVRYSQKRKYSNSSKVRFNCVKVDQSQFTESTLKLVTFVEKRTCVDLKGIHGRFLCTSCPTCEPMSNLFEVHKHVILSQHLKSEGARVTLALIRCGCCGESFSAFKSLLSHCVLTS